MVTTTVEIFPMRLTVTVTHASRAVTEWWKSLSWGEQQALGLYITGIFAGEKDGNGLQFFHHNKSTIERLIQTA